MLRWSRSVLLNRSLWSCRSISMGDGRLAKRGARNEQSNERKRTGRAVRSRPLRHQVLSEPQPKQSKSLDSLFKPAEFKPLLTETNENDDDGSASIVLSKFGAELTGEQKLSNSEIVRVLNKLYRSENIKQLAIQNGLEGRLYHESYLSFRKYCLDTTKISTDLYVLLSDVINNAAPCDALWPFFLEHARIVFPHVTCMDELRNISDLSRPSNWFPEARQIERKIIYHAGPTNSGKTHHALQRFYQAKTGVYCGPLRLLAHEIFQKANNHDTPCDLVTGEERKAIDSDGRPAEHLACTVEMCSVNRPYEVAIVDEIQMLGDQQRGWAWTRALFGLIANEIHVCGDETAIEVVRAIADDCGDQFEVRRYERLTSLTYLKTYVGSLTRAKRGDAIVCFNKQDIYAVSRKLEELGIECAVIYGSLPPGTKLAQAARFNDTDDPGHGIWGEGEQAGSDFVRCKVLVTTDAVGMGLNLNIKRVVFYSITKPQLLATGERRMHQLSTSQALQIAGRAGRYMTEFEHGEVTTFNREDLPSLRRIVQRPNEPIEKVGISITLEQMELFAYYLPNATLSNLIDIFIAICQLDSKRYFMCNLDDFKLLAEMIEHIDLPLRTRYVLCCSPIDTKNSFVTSMFLRFARQIARCEPMTVDWIQRQLDWPVQIPRSLEQLRHLEGVFDVLDMYLWLSYRFVDLFVDPHQVRLMQRDLDVAITEGIRHITDLIQKRVPQQLASEFAEDGKAESSLDLIVVEGKVKERAQTEWDETSSGLRKQRVMEELQKLYRRQLKFNVLEQSDETSSAKTEGVPTGGRPRRQSATQFVASIELDGRVYKGIGKSKSEAKADAAEQALDLFWTTTDQLAEKRDDSIEIEDLPEKIDYSPLSPEPGAVLDQEAIKSVLTDAVLQSLVAKGLLTEDTIKKVAAEAAINRLAAGQNISRPSSDLSDDNGNSTEVTDEQKI